MLVISRCEGEAVNLYDAAGRLIGTVVVARFQRQKLRLGFENFDQSITILRHELSERPTKQEVRPS